MEFKIKLVKADNTFVVADSAEVLAQPSASYQLVDEAGNEVTESLELKRVDGDLEVLVENQPIATIEGFYTVEGGASYLSGDTIMTAESLAGSGAADGVVWQASNSASAASSGLFGLSGAQTLLAGAGIVSGGVAIASLTSGSNEITDTTLPNLSISDDTDGTATGTVTYTFTFDEPVTGFTLDDIEITNGDAAGELTQVSNTVYTLEVLPDIASTESMTVNVAEGAVIDEAGNASTAATESVQEVDTTNITIVFDLVDGEVLSTYSSNVLSNNVEYDIYIVVPSDSSTITPISSDDVFDHLYRLRSSSNDTITLVGNSSNGVTYNGNEVDHVSSTIKKSYFTATWLTVGGDIVASLDNSAFVYYRGTTTSSVQLFISESGSRSYNVAYTAQLPSSVTALFVS